MATTYLSLKEEITTQTAAIIIAHKGQACFDIGETANICGIDRKAIGPEFDKHGIYATKVLKSKRFTATQISEYLHAERISPVSIFKRNPKPFQTGAAADDTT